MSDGDHARALLDMAGKDLRALEGMLDRDVFADEVFGLHAQQAVEKGLKAALSSRKVRYPRTHDLEALVGLLREARITDPPHTGELSELTDFAVQFRYEPYDDDETSLDRESVIAEVRQFLSAVEELVE